MDDWEGQALLLGWLQDKGYLTKDFPVDEFLAAYHLEHEASYELPSLQ